MMRVFNEFGTVDTVREVNARKSAEERAAMKAEAAAAYAAAGSAAAERAAMLSAAPHIRVREWDESRHAYGHDILDATGAPVAVVPMRVWVEGNGTRALEARVVGHFVTTRDGRIADGALVNASSASVEWSFALRYDTQATATSEWLPGGAARAALAHWDVTGGVYDSDQECAQAWHSLLGDCPDQLVLRLRAAKRAAKVADVAAATATSPFAALAALKR